MNWLLLARMSVFALVLRVIVPRYGRGMSFTSGSGCPRTVPIHKWRGELRHWQFTDGQILLARPFFFIALD
jgi:hypothetical protein